MLPQPNFLNLEYFFGLIYSWIFNTSSSTGRVDFRLFFEIPLWFKIISLLFSWVLIVGIVFFLSKLMKLRKEEMADVFSSIENTGTIVEQKLNSRWEKILEHVNSDTPAQWKLAIIEADQILDEIVNTLPIEGENLGEKLKRIEPSDFLTLNDAWEAHKVRNRIAHEAGYEITQREAKRIIGLFENVFREFDFI